VRTPNELTFHSRLANSVDVVVVSSEYVLVTVLKDHRLEEVALPDKAGSGSRYSM
jgi:hypothetical protein